MKDQKECLSEADFAVQNNGLDVQGFKVIQPSFPSLDTIGKSVIDTVKSKTIMFGETNSIKWKIVFLNFGQGRVSTDRPELYPIGSVQKITYEGEMLLSNGKKSKNLTLSPA